MQSGISVSSDLQSSFKTFLSTTSAFALLVSISSSPPQIIPKSPPPNGILESESSSFEENLTKVLAPHITNTEALYIILRHTPSNASEKSHLIIATYVPDGANVRQRMLFASSQLTLKRELGTEHFSETFFCTMARELSAEGWKEHLAHVASPPPLTEEERGLESIRDAEASEVGGTSRRGAGYAPSDGRAGALGSVPGVGKMMNSGNGVIDALRGLKPGGLVSLKINESEQIVLAGDPEVGHAPRDVGGRIATDGPRYTVYHMLEPQDAGVVFIYTCPTVTKVRDRMIYASSRRSAEAVVSDAGIALAKKIEATDPSDITADTLLDEFKPKDQEEKKTGFAKPKRPGRR